MKIARVETIRVQEFAHALWVQVHTDSGLVGLGLGTRLRPEVWQRADATVAVTDRPGPGPVWSLYPFPPSQPLTPEVL